MKSLKAFFLNLLLRKYAVDFLQIAYQGILKREADLNGLAAYSRSLKNADNLTSFLKALSASEEHWEYLLRAHSSEFIRAFFQGLLGRGPDADELEKYSEQLTKINDLIPLLDDMAHCDEYRNHSFKFYSSAIIKAAYIGVLQREVDEKGLSEYIKVLNTPQDLAGVLGGLIESNEFTRKKKRIQLGQHPRDTYDQVTLVFLHIQKTGGTSLQYIFKDSFGEQAIYQEHDDSLHLYSPSELSNYAAFLGHFNYDSLIFIPRKSLELITFVRKPKERLISLYHFLRAHDLSKIIDNPGAALANELAIDLFFQNTSINRNDNIWNHMTWVVIGHRQWKRWQDLLLKEETVSSADHLITSEIRPAIIQRLKEFVFIGFQDDFDRSVKMLFHILNRPLPKTIYAEHTLAGLIKKDSNFKKTIEEQPMTKGLDSILDGLIQLDNIIYEEASNIYDEHLRKYARI